MKAYRVLVVDDDNFVRDALVAYLSIHGYDVVAAVNGELALQEIDHRRPDVVLLDQNMPILDGSGVVKALRERGMTLPVLAMTADRNGRQWADHVGAAGFLAKPFALSELLHQVEKAGALAGSMVKGV